MTATADTLRLVNSIVRLRRAERVRRAAPDVAPVRRQLESQLGPTLSRSRASKILGVSQTALDRWVAAGQIPVVITPNGRREVPRQVVLELRESLDRLRLKGITRHPLSAALAERREKASRRKPADARDLRQSSPFAGILNEHERRRIIESVR